MKNKVYNKWITKSPEVLLQDVLITLEDSNLVELSYVDYKIDKNDKYKMTYGYPARDANKYDKNFSKFKKIHKFAKREKAIKEQEEKEIIAVEEFKKLDKSDFTVRVRDGKCKVKAIFYKGFAIHDSVDSVDAEDDVYKTITVAEGKNTGIKLLSCNITEYKTCIDEIRKIIGDKQLEESDLDKLKDIIKKYW